MPRFQLTRDTFVGVGTSGYLAPAGEIVDIPDEVFMAPEDLDTYHRPNSNVIALGADGEAALRTIAPQRSIGPSSPNADAPQGLPSGTRQYGSTYIQGGREPGSEVTELTPATYFNDEATRNAHENNADQVRASQESGPFIQGVGEVNPETGEPLRQTGTDPQGGETPVTSGPKSVYDGYTKEQLGDALEEAGVEVPEDAKLKRDLVALAEANSDKVPPPPAA